MASSSSRPLLCRLAELASGRVRANYRMLSSAFSSTASTERVSQSPAEPEAVLMTEGCVRRLKELHAKEPSSEGKMLRLSVEAGGCSGFQYSFALDDKKNSDDRVFETDGVKLVVDDISYDFVKGATVDYEEELIRSAFVVSTNPSAVGGCSCKSSFMVK
ncbi:protein aq_1857 [Zea mays]|uniref:Iron-sulfur assembly protein IscA-like 2 mitochondrial n=1 Tax=Zea mays TaxID=4577 RepID=B6T2K9_MAIZE|nr:protein aq_1857 [Zea mays]ACG31342.1 protein aq_1857 [Zea mays]AQK50040.1 Iron-sulfur assembly protein IscA-like 2 mitochondrial [Zea mays]|eukprot:NP_001148399.1 protein aq_1857 [Zea mays]